MSTINGLTGPRVPTSSPSATREAPRTSFASRVQAGVSGGVSIRPANAPLVSGRDVVAQTVAAARQEAATSGAAQEPGTPAMSQEEKAVREMARMSLMNTVQSLFQGFGQMPKPDQD